MDCLFKKQIKKNSTGWFSELNEDVIFPQFILPNVKDTLLDQCFEMKDKIEQEMKNRRKQEEENKRKIQEEENKRKIQEEENRRKQEQENKRKIQEEEEVKRRIRIQEEETKRIQEKENRRIQEENAKHEEEKSKNEDSNSSSSSSLKLQGVLVSAIILFVGIIFASKKTDQTDLSQIKQQIVREIREYDDLNEEVKTTVVDYPTSSSERRAIRDILEECLKNGDLHEKQKFALWKNEVFRLDNGKAIKGVGHWEIQRNGVKGKTTVAQVKAPNAIQELLNHLSNTTYQAQYNKVICEKLIESLESQKTSKKGDFIRKVYFTEKDFETSLNGSDVFVKSNRKPPKQILQDVQQFVFECERMFLRDELAQKLNLNAFDKVSFPQICDSFEKIDLKFF